MANSIEDLKALANTKLGFARSNRFLVTLPSVGAGGGLLGGIIGIVSQAAGTGTGGGAGDRRLNRLKKPPLGFGSSSTGGRLAMGTPFVVPDQSGIPSQNLASSSDS